MSRYLAAIFGLWALTTPSLAVVVPSAQSPQLSQETQPPPVATPSAQDSPQSGAPASPSATPAPQSGQEPPAAKPEGAKKPESQAKTPSKKRRRRKTGASASTATPTKKVVRNGGTADPAVQLAPSMSAEQASSQLRSTTQLLAETDANLKQISSRPVNSGQQDSISQIRQYMEQAKVAEQAGDVERAYNLASKALLLSNDLVKP